MTITFGEVSWNDDVFTGGGNVNKNTKDLYLRLDEGSNEMRLVTQPFQYLVHKYKKEGDVGWGQKVSCSAVHGSCPLCADGDKAKPRWLLGVISRKTNTYKILDISYAVFSQIRKLARNTKHWGDPTKYDIDIIVDKMGGPTGYYSVQALSKDPLSAADQQIKDKVDVDYLKRRITPLTPEEVQKRIDKINGADDVAQNPPTGKTSASTLSSTAKVDMSDDEDEAFPDYDSK